MPQLLVEKRSAVFQTADKMSNVTNFYGISKSTQFKALVLSYSRTTNSVSSGMFIVKANSDL